MRPMAHSKPDDIAEKAPSARWNARVFLRRLRLGLPELLGLGGGGYFIPYSRAGQSPAPARYPAIETVLRASADDMLRRLGDIEALADDLLAIGWNTPAPDARWNQDWFPWLDAALAYSMARTVKPALWLEIGSGHSTRFVARAIRDGATGTRLVAIDPKPRAALGSLAVQWHETIAQEADRGIYRELKAGDVLFVDSSHILMPGTDVDFVMNEVLPAVPSGTYLHVHDIFLPDAYPAQWSWRGYNEQNGVAALIVSGAWAVLGASHFMDTRLHSAVMAGVMGRLKRPPGPVSSLWLRKR